MYQCSLKNIFRAYMPFIYASKFGEILLQYYTSSLTICYISAKQICFQPPEYIIADGASI